jgi:hypothetical protein
LSSGAAGVSWGGSQSGRWLATGVNAADFETYWTGADIVTYASDDTPIYTVNFYTVKNGGRSDQPRLPDTWSDVGPEGWWATPYLRSGDFTIPMTVRKKSNPAVSKTFQLKFRVDYTDGCG